MTNLEWIRTLSAKELSDLLYDYWLPRGQYVWTDSRKGLVKMLGETYLERDCDKCKHQGNCYCVKGLGCPFESKTEPTISKMEQVEDETRLTAKCLNCANGGSYKCSKCDGEMYYKYDKDEPQTDYNKSLELFAEVLFDKEKSEQFLKECKAMGIEPQTDCSWK